MAVSRHGLVFAAGADLLELDNDPGGVRPRDLLVCWGGGAGGERLLQRLLQAGNSGPFCFVCVGAIASAGALAKSSSRPEGSGVVLCLTE